MGRAVTSEAGETLDMVCWRTLGTTGSVDAVLEANPGLAALGALLPAGTSIILPDQTPSAATAVRETIQLWS